MILLFSWKCELKFCVRLILSNDLFQNTIKRKESRNAKGTQDKSKEVSKMENAEVP